ncbi:MAG: ABC transporter permease subunit [Anaerolineaceae bacterium]|nr:ABC transporter permease subunit [Anaerolineaceae bacterium]
MNWKAVFTIAKKDIKEARQNKSVWLPVLIVPLIFVVIMPVGLILGVSSATGAVGNPMNDPDFAVFLEKMPEFMSKLINGMDSVQSSIVLLLGYLFAPFFLILPLMFSTVIASESFAGERERKTIEALLYTPATDTELLMGKVMAGFIPAVLITLGSFVMYILVVNGAAYPVMGRIWFPLPSWYALILWVSPAISLLGIAATVLISARVQTFMGAYQSSASLVLLVLVLLAGQATGVVYLSVAVSLLIGAGIFAIDAILMYYAVRTFNRDKLLASAA